MLETLQEHAHDGSYSCEGITVSQLGARWLSEHVEVNLKPGAIASYRAVFYHHVRPVLGELRLQDC